MGFVIEMGINVAIFIFCVVSLVFAAQYIYKANKKKREAEENRKKYDLARKKEENLNAGN